MKSCAELVVKSVLAGYGTIKCLSRLSELLSFKRREFVKSRKVSLAISRVDSVTLVKRPFAGSIRVYVIWRACFLFFDGTFYAGFNSTALS